MQGERIELPLVIGGEEVTTGKTAETVMPHKKDHVLADVHQGGPAEVERAIEAAAEAWEDWSRLPWEERAAVFLRGPAALVRGPAALVRSTPVFLRSPAVLVRRAGVLVRSAALRVRAAPC